MFSKRLKEHNSSVNKRINSDTDNPNVEAEKDETVVGDFTGTGFPEHYTIGGNKHSAGGTLLSVPENSFIFSDAKYMKIKDKDILKEFNMPKSSKGYTPADIAKKYDINKYLGILYDETKSKLDKTTSEAMIKNYVQKLSKLSLVQESMKGFPDGIPYMAMPYLITHNIDPKSIIPQQPLPMKEQGGQIFNTESTYKVRITDIPMAQAGISIDGNKTSSETPSNNATSSDQFDLLNKTFEGLSNNDWKKIIPIMIEEIKNSNSKSLSSDDKKAALDILESGNIDKVKKAIKNVQANVYTANQSGLFNPKSEVGKKYKINDKNLWDKQPDGKRGYDLWFKDYGKQIIDAGYDKVTPVQTALDEAMLKTIKNIDKYPMLQNTSWSNYKSYYEGAPDEPSANKNVSSVTGWFGNTTIGEGLHLLPQKTPTPKQSAQKQPVLEQPVKATEEATVGNKYKPIDPKFWAQDVLNTANSVYDFLNVKKYLPWAKKANAILPEAVYMDPTRAIAAISEQANKTTDTINSYANPQATRAALSSIQGKAGAQAANVAAEYNAKNVNIANTHEKINADILNKVQQYNDAIDTNLYDKTIIANQQYDNALTAARNNVISAVKDSITNRAKAQALNELYDYVHLYPEKGGYITQDREGKIKPENSTSRLEQLNNILSGDSIVSKYIQNNPTTTNTILKYILDNKQTSTKSNNSTQEILDMLNSMYPTSGANQ